MIDQHLESLGIDQILSPVSLTADDFREKVAALPGGTRAKASEMEHAIRHHLEVNFGKDHSATGCSVSGWRRSCNKHQENWEQQLHALSDPLADLEQDRLAEDDPLTPVERALYGVLLEETGRTRWVRWLGGDLRPSLRAWWPRSASKRTAYEKPVRLRLAGVNSSDKDHRRRKTV